MRPLTLDELQERLDNDLQWRRTELVALLGHARNFAAQSHKAPVARVLLRGGVALLYAHWEGYTKTACQEYLNYVATRRLKIAELSDSFIGLGVRHIAKAMVHSERGQSKERALKLAKQGSTHRLWIPTKNVVETRSNLSYENLRQLLDQLGLPVTPFATKANMIDRSLCTPRHEIAHGRESLPTLDEYEHLHRDVIDLLGAVRDVVADAAAGNRYRASAPVEQ